MRRDKTPSGSLIVANSTIITNNATNPARFEETFNFPGAASVAYNVINLSDDFSVEYDCGESVGITNVSQACKHATVRHCSLSLT
jgi:hypothetical protein